MIKFKHTGNFNKTEKFFKKVSMQDYLSIFKKYGQIGVEALASVTPVSSGKTASSWSYVIKRTNKGVTLSWSNSNIQNGVPIAILIQYGHGTGNGGFVQGRDYINPAIKPIFDSMTDDIWREVTKR